MNSPRTLREDAVAIWKAGVAAVDSERLVRNAILRHDSRLEIAGHPLRLVDFERIAVVGAGKAGAGMAAGFESAIGDDLLETRVEGWINVPEDCVRPLRRIHLHGARPAAVNEPTAAGVEGSRRILELVGSLGPRDLCLVLLSGGGSALLPAPADGLTLEDKQQVTRQLMRSGAAIQELNCVRKHLSRVKGGRLAGATKAGLVVTLAISDVIGDPLDIIASGPTAPDPTSPADALAILERFHQDDRPFPSRVIQHLKEAQSRWQPDAAARHTVWNHVIGNNRVAMGAAAEEALRLGYAVADLGSENRGIAREVGVELARKCREVANGEGNVSPPACLLSGGEPVVHLAETDRPHKGGRNQEVALAAIDEWRRLEGAAPDNVVILSGGTDGEDGPTDAAGGIADARASAEIDRQSLDPKLFLDLNNAYEILDRAGALLKTGPTHTNVMDLRVCLVGKPE